MKTASVRELKKELSYKTTAELKDLCLHLSRFKKENKELLTYLLFEAHDEESYINSIKNQMESQFLEINTKSYFYIRKSLRKILSQTKKYIRKKKKKETEVELLLYYCKSLKNYFPSFNRSQRLVGIFETQVRMINKAIDKLHEDLQYDYKVELDNLLND